MAGAYLKAPCPGGVSTGTLWAVGVRGLDAFSRRAGRAEIDHPGGHIIVSRKRIVTGKEKLQEKNSYRREAFATTVVLPEIGLRKPLSFSWQSEMLPFPDEFLDVSHLMGVQTLL